MEKKWHRIIIFALIGLMLLSVSTACTRARVPATGEQPNGPADTPGDNKQADTGPKVFSYPIDATLSGKEFGLENVRFTHIAFKADDSMEWMVAVWVTLNEEFQGKIYANGWEDKVDEKLRIGPGDTSVWVPLRGTWLTGENILKLKFLTPSVGDVELPARYFKGVMYLKNDPALHEKEITGETVDPGPPPGETSEKTDATKSP